MPRLVVEGIHAAGREAFLLCFPGITGEPLIAMADGRCTMHLTQLRKAARACRKRGIHELIMAGRIPHKSIFSLPIWRFDWLALQLWWRLPDKRADTLLAGLAHCLKGQGIDVLDSTRYLRDYLAKEGVLTRQQPTPQEMRDVLFGAALAKKMGALDIGQTVVVKHQSVVAVEAMEGTDACLQRAHDVAGAGCVAVKLSKPGQDMRFDVPVIGPTTLEKLAKIQARVLAIEAGKTLMIGDDLLQQADRLGLVIVALPAQLPAAP